MAILGSVDIPFTNSGQIAIEAKEIANTANGTANNAIDAANGKNKVYHQPTVPTGETFTNGDMWFNTSLGNQLKVYDGTTWVLSKFDFNALIVNQLSALSADLGNVTAGNITGVTMSLAGGKFTIDSSGKISISTPNRWGNDAALNLQNADITGLNGLYMKDVADNEGEGILFLKNGRTPGDYGNAIADYWTLRVDGAGNLLLDSKIVANSAIGALIWDGYAYPADGSELTPTRKLQDCPNGWVLVWSDFDAPSTPNNWNYYTSVIPKAIGDNGSNWSFAIPVGSSTGVYDQLASKQLTIYNDRIVGEAGNGSDLSADVVLRYVICY